MKRIRLFIRLSLYLSLAPAILLNSPCPVFAQDMTQDMQDMTQKQEDEQEIEVRIKADVPKDFDASVSVQYEGKATEGFAITLSAADTYTALINLPADIYTYKQSTVPDGYSIDLPKSFLISGGNRNTYLLPITVNADDSEDQKEYVNVKASADFSELEEEYAGEIKEINLNYSGTNGNSVTFGLSGGNGYTSEVSIEKDLYTLKSVELGDGYFCDTLYSFNTMELNADSNYEFTAKVRVKTAADEEKPEEPKKKLETREVSVRAQFPDDFQFDGNIYISYSGDATSAFDVELNKENNYFATVDIPYGRYQLLYSVSYDTDEYTFSAQPSFTLGGTSGSTEILIYVLKDGKILQNESLEETPDQTQTDAMEKESSGFGFRQIISIFVLVAILVAFIVYFAVKTVKRRKQMDDMQMDEDEDEEQPETQRGEDDGEYQENHGTELRDDPRKESSARESQDRED